MNGRLREALLNKLEILQLKHISSAVSSNTTSCLPLNDQQKLVEVANLVKCEYGLKDHELDVGFPGASPASGASGRFKDIIE